jgi:hypothetical protein
MRRIACGLKAQSRMPLVTPLNLSTRPRETTQLVLSLSVKRFGNVERIDVARRGGTLIDIWLATTRGLASSCAPPCSFFWSFLAGDESETSGAGWQTPLLGPVLRSFGWAARSRKPLAEAVLTSFRSGACDAAEMALMVLSKRARGSAFSRISRYWSS